MKKQAPVVIIRLKGGLGNQMFQYAMGRRLALAAGLELKLDRCSGFRRDHVYRREYLLDQFHVEGVMADRRESFCDLIGDLRRRFHTWRGVGDPERFNYVYVQEKDPHGFEPWLLKFRPKGTVYLDGQWMSPRYFEGYEARFRREFSSRFPLSPDAEEEARAIRAAANPVCLGIRTFGDVSEQNRRVMEAHGVIPRPDFFSRALALLYRRFGQLDLFVFAMDPDWVRANLPLPQGARVISPKPENSQAYEDLNLMRLCRHYVISYSSYYWWGAYLSENMSDKVVVVPDLGRINANMIPGDWTRIPPGERET